jgi:hypothetical protein
VACLGFPEDDPAYYAPSRDDLLNDVGSSSTERNRLELITWEMAAQSRLKLQLQYFDLKLL